MPEVSPSVERQSCKVRSKSFLRILTIISVFDAVVITKVSLGGPSKTTNTLAQIKASEECMEEMAYQIESMGKVLQSLVDQGPCVLWNRVCPTISRILFPFERPWSQENMEPGSRDASSRPSAEWSRLFLPPSLPPVACLPALSTHHQSHWLPLTHLPSLSLPPAVCHPPCWTHH